MARISPKPGMFDYVEPRVWPNPADVSPHYDALQSYVRKASAADVAYREERLRRQLAYRWGVDLEVPCITDYTSNPTPENEAHARAYLVAQGVDFDEVAKLAAYPQRYILGVDPSARSAHDQRKAFDTMPRNPYYSNDPGLAAWERELLAPYSPPTPSFDSTIKVGTRVKVTRKNDATEVAEFVVRGTSTTSTGRLVTLRALGSSGPRFNAADYTAEVVLPDLPTALGYYVTKGNTDLAPVLYLLHSGGWRKVNPQGYVEAMTAERVKSAAGIKGLVKLEVAA